MTVLDTIDYWLISVEQVGGCTVYSNFTGQAHLTAVFLDAGLHNEIWVCPSYSDFLILDSFLLGKTNPGGHGQSEYKYSLWYLEYRFWAWPLYLLFTLSA